jgi:glyoxylase-like metal-dependent hydrolase (beta-lactamase superfamily II)
MPRVKITRSILWIVALAAMPFHLLADAGKLELQRVTDDVYAIVGELGNRSPENLGNNATFGFVVTADGVVLIDSGGTTGGARDIERVIRTVTDKPVIKVINTGGQDHRWLGNAYFRKQGAEIIASEAAVADQKARVQDQFFMLGNLVGADYVKETEAVYAGQTFAEEYSFEAGDTVFELRFAGQAHTPGDSFVWLPRQKVMFSGDIVYTQRMLNVSAQSHSKSWMSAFEAMAAYQPEFLVPGHGRATSLEQARKDTWDYLDFLRRTVAEFIDEGGDITDIGSIDQSRFDYLLNHDTLAGRNAQQVFTELEWE